MNALDIVIVGTTLFSAIIGMFCGAIKLLLQIASLFLGIFLTIKLYPLFLKVVGITFISPEFTEITFIIITFCVIYAIFLLIVHMLGKSIDKFSGFFNQAIGFIIGAFIGFTLSVLVIMGLNRIVSERYRELFDSCYIMNAVTETLFKVDKGQKKVKTFVKDKINTDKGKGTK